MEIKSTIKEEFGLEPDSEIINIINMVLPRKIEDEYVKLGNLVLQHISKCRELSRYNGNLHNSAKDLNISDTKLAELEEAGISVNQELATLASGLSTNSSPDVYRRMMELSEKGKKISKIKEKLRLDSSTKRDNHMTDSLTAGNIQNEIANIIKEIQMSLQRISELDINGEKRLDNLSLTEKHLAMIDSLPINEKVKPAVKKYIESYIKMRISSFKKLEEKSYKILEAYSDRKLFDNMDSLDSAECYLSVMSLRNINPEYHANVIIPRNELQIEGNYTEAQIMDFITNYNNGESIDVEQVKKSNEALVDYNYHELLQILLDSGLIEYQNQNQMESSSKTI